jgi:hypothetical protein
MIRRLRAWWRRYSEHWQKKRELLLEAEKIMRQWNYAPASFEDIELYLLQIGILHLEAASMRLTVIPSAKDAGVEGFESAGSHRVH